MRLSLARHSMYMIRLRCIYHSYKYPMMLPFCNRTHTVVCLIKLLSAVSSHLKYIQTCYYHHFHYHQHHIFQNSICSCFYCFFFFSIQMNFFNSKEFFSRFFLKFKRTDVVYSSIYYRLF